MREGKRGVQKLGIQYHYDITVWCAIWYDPVSDPDPIEIDVSAASLAIHTYVYVG